MLRSLESTLANPDRYYYNKVSWIISSTFAIQCARESGKIQRKFYEKHFAIHHKGDINLVTDVDIACQERIIKLI